jgi:predicted O-methyltransferase YrrM
MTMTIDEAVVECLKIQGWKTQDELVWLARQAQKSKVVIDIGCWRGRTTKLMAAVMRHRGVLVAVDHLAVGYTGETARNQILRTEGNLKILQDFLKNLDKEISEGLVQAIFMDGDEAREAVKNCLNGIRADFCWIDGDHKYEDVVADIKAYLPLMKPGGVFAGHDYEKSFPDVMRAVEELCPGFERGPGTAWIYNVPKEG